MLLNKIFIFSVLIAFSFLISCGEKKSSATPTMGDKAVPSSEEYDPNRGQGKFDESNLIIEGFDSDLASKGDGIANTKCASCHKMTDERLVGPGWAGVTQRRTAPWIMNFITDPDPMIDRDPELQAQLELCLVRMPNQNLNEEDARAVYEYMRKVDGAN
jgi:hypothetical protein